MKSLPRLYLPEAVSATTRTLSRAQSHHLRRVLRLRNGAALEVFDGEGNEFNASLSMNDNEVHAIIKQCIRHEALPALVISMVVAIERATRMEWTLEKAVELGVMKVYPVYSERSKVRLPAEHIEKRLSQWHSVMVAAVAQCARARLPKLFAPRGMDETFQDIHADSRIALLPEARLALPSLPAPGNNLALLIGPESGFSAKEADMIVASGWQPARLGPRILRAETAGPAALAAVQVLWGDWRE